MIQLKIHRESDFYNPLDPSQTIIHNDVLKYLKSSCAGSSPKEHRNDTLQIYCDGPMDTDKAKRAIEDAVLKDCAEFDRKIAQNNRRAIAGYVMGITLSILGIALSLMLDQVLLAIIAFIGSTAVKDALSLQTKDNHDIKQMKSLLDPLLDLKVETIRN